MARTADRYKVGSALLGIELELDGIAAGRDPRRTDRGAGDVRFEISTERIEQPQFGHELVGCNLDDHLIAHVQLELVHVDVGGRHLL